jgi:hypothetical protein
MMTLIRDTIKPYIVSCEGLSEPAASMSQTRHCAVIVTLALAV